MIGSLAQRFGWSAREVLDFDDVELRWWMDRAAAISEAERSAISDH